MRLATQRVVTKAGRRAPPLRGARLMARAAVEWLPRLTASAASPAAYELSGSIGLTSEPITIFYQDAAGTGVHKASFPMLPKDSPQLQALKDACVPAAFGQGFETKIDPEVRKALQMPASRLGTGLGTDLPGAALLADIRALMMPDAAAVRAEPYALNIYGPGDFFKPHRDTPRHRDMFGSLVLCLPTQFSGGQLIIRSPDGASEVRHDWGASALTGGPGAGRIAWAAFYSDTEHEIEPVVQGHRVTLTYNLYSQATAGDESAETTPAAPAAAPAAAASLGAAAPLASGFGPVLASALRDPTWYPDGITLGFALEHLYVVDKDYKPLPTAITPGMLKGTDLLLHRAARKLGLTPRIVPVLQSHAKKEGEYGEWDEDEEEWIENEAEVPLRLGVGDGFYKDPQDEWFEPEVTEADFLEGRHGMRVEPENVVWVRPPEQRHMYYTDHVRVQWGNEGATTSWYAAAALMIDIPAAGAGVRQAP